MKLLKIIDEDYQCECIYIPETSVKFILKNPNSYRIFTLAYEDDMKSELTFRTETIKIVDLKDIL